MTLFLCFAFTCSKTFSKQCVNLSENGNTVELKFESHIFDYLSGAKNGQNRQHGNHNYHLQVGDYGDPLLPIYMNIEAP